MLEFFGNFPIRGNKLSNLALYLTFIVLLFVLAYIYYTFTEFAKVQKQFENLKKLGKDALNGLIDKWNSLVNPKKEQK